MPVDTSYVSGLIADAKTTEQKITIASKIIREIVAIRMDLSRQQINELEDQWEDSFGWRLNIRMAGE